jgi:hypothetical protein
MEARAVTPPVEKPPAAALRFEVSYPPRIMNLQWHKPRPDVEFRADVINSLIDFAKHLAEGPCPVYLLSLQYAHSGPRRVWLCWLYNKFRELEPEDAFWHGHAPAEFMREHTSINRRLARMYQESRDLWVVLREDLSHRPDDSAADFARARFIQIEEVTIRPGRAREFARVRRALVDAFGAADIAEPAWVYEVHNGDTTDSFQVWRPYPSLSPLDRIAEDRQRIEKILGDAGVEKVAEDTAASVLRSETAFFGINPTASYVSTGLSKHDPHFWTGATAPWP